MGGQSGRWLTLTVALLAGTTAQAARDLERDDAGAFADLSLEQLMDEPVTSVSKKQQRLGDVAAAITVLTNDDLRRSGVATVADALRLVPGLDVASANASQTAISARGANGLYANKLLVLVDGRAIYTVLFGGVYWDLENLMLEDIDRIEVIRGPGATIWGANAVNGVINVVTRAARDTQGGYLYGGGGDVQRASGGGRFGGRIGEGTYYRLFASYWNNDDFPLANGDPAGDAWHGWHSGFRLDQYRGRDTHLTWEAAATKVDLDQVGDEIYNLNTVGRWTRSWSSRSSVELQAYLDRTHRNEDERIRDTVDTADFSFQHTLGLGAANDLIWGFGYRFTGISMQPFNPAIQIRDPEFALQLYSAFVQDQWTVVPDKLMLTAGVKLEHNAFTGLEVQPSVRGVFKPAAQQSLWAAISRAVRNPDVAEGHDAIGITVGEPFPGPGGGAFLPTVVGSSEVKSEVLWAYELGYRIEPMPRLNVDVATFYNDYSRLISYGQPQALIAGTPFGIAEIPATNQGSGDSYGGEIAIGFSPLDSVRLGASCSLLFARLHDAADATMDDPTAPRYQAKLRASYDFSRHASVDAFMRYVDSIQGVPAYLTADLRLAYRPTERLELSLTGRNLLDNQHPEQNAVPFAVTSEVPRSVTARLSWRF